MERKKMIIRVPQRPMKLKHKNQKAEPFPNQTPLPAINPRSPQGLDTKKPITSFPCY